MRQKLLYLPAFCMLLLALPLYAQVEQLSDSLADSTSVRAGQFTRVGAGPADGSYVPSLTKKSPGTAMLLSAILPGAGQFYNGSYWKVPIVLGFGLYFVSSWLDNNRRYEDYRDKYNAYLVVNPAGNPNLLRVREFYKDQRDSFAWYFVVLYLLSLADSYVDASLSDFNVGDDLSVRFLPDFPGPRPPSLIRAAQSAQIRLQFNF